MTSYYHRPPADCSRASQTAKAKGQTLIMSRQKELFLIRHECKIWMRNEAVAHRQQLQLCLAGNWFQLETIFTLIYWVRLSTGAGERVCASYEASSRLIFLTWIKLPLCAIAHVLAQCWRVDAGTAISPRSREASGAVRVWGGLTNILVAHYQQQHKHRLAVYQLLKGGFICMCVQLHASGWSEGAASDCQGGRFLPSGRRVITREHAEDKKY